MITYFKNYLNLPGNRFFRFIKKLRILLLQKTIWKNYEFGIGFHCGLNVRFWSPSTFEVGDYVYIGHNCTVQTNIQIGHFTIFGNNVAIIGKYDHDFKQVGTPISLARKVRDVEFADQNYSTITKIGNDVWVGYGAIILSGVTIPDGCIIAAGSLVNSTCEPYSIYGGIPAKKIGDRFDSAKDRDLHIKDLQIKYPFLNK